MNTNKTILIDQLNTLFPDNNQGLITPQRVRGFLANVLDSAYLKSEITIPAFGIYENVKNYGAVGDGVTDDTTAFITALATGKNIYIPEGSFRITSTISLSSSQQLLGAGGNSILIFDGIDFTNNCGIVTNEGSIVKDFVIQGINNQTDLTIIKIVSKFVVVVSIVFVNVPKAIDVNYIENVDKKNSVTITNCLFIANTTAIVVNRNNLLRVIITNCNFIANGRALDLFNFFIDVKGCQFLGTDLIYLNQESEQLNPLIGFENCRFEELTTGCTIGNHVTNTANILQFKGCLLDGLTIDSIDSDTIIQLFACELINATISTTNPISMFLTQNVLRTPLTFDRYKTTLVLGENMIYDATMQRFILKQAEL